MSEQLEPTYWLTENPEQPDMFPGDWPRVNWRQCQDCRLVFCVGTSPVARKEDIPRVRPSEYRVQYCPNCGEQDIARVTRWIIRPDGTKTPQ